MVARQSGSEGDADSIELPPSTSMAIMYTSTTDLGKESTSTLETIMRSRREEMDRISLSYDDEKEERGILVSFPCKLP